MMTRSQILQFITCNLCLGQKSLAPASSPEPTLQFHEPPSDTSQPFILDGNEKKDYYKSNPSPFGRILEGTLPSYTYRETENTLTFRDRSPKAQLHALIIPKRYIPTIKHLKPQDIDLLYEMKQEAIEILREFPSYSEKYNGEDILRKKDYILCFHVPPFNSVDHLHLHVLAPKSSMNPLFSFGKYRIGTRWCTSLDEVIFNLEAMTDKLTDGRDDEQTELVQS